MEFGDAIFTTNKLGTNDNLSIPMVTQNHRPFVHINHWSTWSIGNGSINSCDSVTKILRFAMVTPLPGVNRSELVARASSDDTCALPVGGPWIWGCGGYHLLILMVGLVADRLSCIQLLIVMVSVDWQWLIMVGQSWLLCSGWLPTSQQHEFGMRKYMFFSLGPALAFGVSIKYEWLGGTSHQQWPMVSLDG